MAMDPSAESMLMEIAANQKSNGKLDPQVAALADQIRKSRSGSLHRDGMPARVLDSALAVQRRGEEVTGPTVAREMGGVHNTPEGRRRVTFALWSLRKAGRLDGTFPGKEDKPKPVSPIGDTPKPVAKPVVAAVTPPEPVAKPKRPDAAGSLSRELDAIVAIEAALRGLPSETARLRVVGVVSSRLQEEGLLTLAC